MAGGMSFGFPAKGAQKARLTVIESPNSARVPGCPLKRW
jgi:hypothetical protein